MVGADDLIAFHPTHADGNSPMNAKISGSHHRLTGTIKHELLIQQNNCPSVGDFMFSLYEALTANSQTAYKILNIGGFLAWVGQIQAVGAFQLNG
jgi:hypothetical protein